MNNIKIPEDDLMDVIEMTQKLEKAMNDILDDNQRTLAMSALMSATINRIISECDTIQQVFFYRNLYFNIFDASINTIDLK